MNLNNMNILYNIVLFVVILLIIIYFDNKNSKKIDNLYKKVNETYTLSGLVEIEKELADYNTLSKVFFFYSVGIRIKILNKLINLKKELIKELK